MSLFFPDINLTSITKLDKALLNKHGVKGLIIDIDNTLTGHNSQEISEEIAAWVTNIKIDFPAILLSNNFRERVEVFAKNLDMNYISMALKPLPFAGFSKAAKQLGLKPREVAVVGDQIFTDILGGNLFGATTIRVNPIFTEESRSIGFKRKLEKRIMEKYHEEKGGQND